MVSRIEDVAAFVQQAITAAADSQGQTMSAKLAEMKVEILRETAAASGATIAEARGTIEKVVKDSAEVQTKERQELELRMSEAMRQMNAALMKFGSIEAGISPMLEPRFNSIEAGVAELDRIIRKVNVDMASVQANVKAASTSSARPEAEAAPISPVRPEAAPGFKGVPATEAACEPARPEVHVMSSPSHETRESQPSQVPWPKPAEVAAEAAAWRSAISPARISQSPVPAARSLVGEFEGVASVPSADPEMNKNIWERKMFDKRLSKYSNEKGPKEFTDRTYELRRITASDPDFHAFLKWLEEDPMTDSMGVVTAQVLKDQGMAKGWKIEWLNTQLYGVLAEATSGRAKQTVMGRENDTSFNGAAIYKEFAHQHLDGSKQATVALGKRITEPPAAPLDEFEDRLREWDKERERYERLASASSTS